MSQKRRISDVGLSITEAQTDLIAQMQHEIRLMREILANMHEEQEAILETFKEKLVAIMQARKELFNELVKVRTLRMNSVQTLATLLSQGNGERLFSEKEGLTTLLANDSDEACEILSLRDQMVALVEKMNEQNCRNSDLVKHQIVYPNQSQRTPPKHLRKPKTKRVLVEDEI